MNPDTPANCVLCVGSDETHQPWADFLATRITEAGLIPVAYSVATLDAATCLLAFPQGDERIIYQLGYAIGRSVPALAVTERPDELAVLDPQPETVRVSISVPEQPENIKRDIVARLSGLARLPRAASVRGNKAPSAPILGEFSRYQVTSIEQAEELFAGLAREGVAQHNIRNLLTQAGCRPSWIDLRLKLFFGGW